MAKTSGIPIEQWSGSGATEALHQTIRDSTRHTTQLLVLTWVIAALTFVMTVGLVVQIYLAFYPPPVGH